MSQGELLKLDHDSLQKRRLRKPKKDAPYWSGDRVNTERVYAAAWKRQNRYVSYEGWPFLSLLLCKDGARPTVVTRRDAAVAASVIQWLGTAVGHGFVMTCERKIDEQRDAADRKATRRLLDQQRERAEKLQAEWDAERRGPVRRGVRLKKEA